MFICLSNFDNIIRQKTFVSTRSFYINDDPIRSNMKLNICISETAILEYLLQHWTKTKTLFVLASLIIFVQNIRRVPCTQYNKSLGPTNVAERKSYRVSMIFFYTWFGWDVYEMEWTRENHLTILRCKSTDVEIVPTVILSYFV